MDNTIRVENLLNLLQYISIQTNCPVAPVLKQDDNFKPGYWYACLGGHPTWKESPTDATKETIKRFMEFNNFSKINYDNFDGTFIYA